MTTPTVAKRKLQDATRCSDGDPYCDYSVRVYPSGTTRDRQPARPPGACRCRWCAAPNILHYHYDPGIEPGSACWRTSMEIITVDGHRTINRDNYGTYIFNFRDGPDCVPDSEGYCRCFPREYQPVRYYEGDICDLCWIKLGLINGIGRYACKHGEAWTVE